MRLEIPTQGTASSMACSCNPYGESPLQLQGTTGLVVVQLKIPTQGTACSRVVSAC